MFKPANIVGIIIALLLIGSCYMEWVFIAPRDWHISGMQVPMDKAFRLGRPAFLSIWFTGISILLFLIPKIWAKRVNTYVTMLGMGWAIRSFLLITRCESGYCPEKKMGLYFFMLLTLLLIPANLFALVAERKGKENIVSAID